MTATERRASAYLRDGKIYLNPFSKTIKKLWIACEPIVVSGEDNPDLGDQVLQVLARSTDNIPHPESLHNSDQWSSVKALVKAAGTRSYEAFANSTRCVGIMQDESGVIFTPRLNGGFRRRFLNLKTKIHSRPVPTEVAAALMAAFDACTWE